MSANSISNVQYMRGICTYEIRPISKILKTKMLPACKVMDSQTCKYWDSFVDVRIGSFCVLKVSLHIGIKILPACKVMDGQIWKYK